ncbi:hypothetical protein JMJ77_0008079 [Colletotrichum scovillei]|uniref:Uncharacterized protein n=1 Tax=Colletotrichum scovillei TaxID=1209932 RepID=A0A9P7RE29_9PEZI|nr:hypothetical protein JMJ77_0008079 [Colletotrichum scovillei]
MSIVSGSPTVYTLRHDLDLTRADEHLLEP